MSKAQFKTVDQKSVVEVIREQVWSLIFKGELTPGSRLPSEKELTEQLGVSRPALREALHTLVGEGLLEIRCGQGTYVQELSSASAIQSEVVSLLLASESLKEIQEVRRILEPEIAARVAESATEAELDSLEDILSNMEEAVFTGRSIFDLAWNFHRRLSQVAGNSVMAKIVDILYEMIRAAERPLYDRHFDPQEEIRGHRELLRVLRTQDPEQARVAMAVHIGAVDEGLESALEAEQQATPG